MKVFINIYKIKMILNKNVLNLMKIRVIKIML